MPVRYGNRVKESSATTGTGSYTLDGAVPGYRTFDADLDTGHQCYYVAEYGTEYEVGLGTFTSPSTLARTTIFNSSNSDAAVSWGAGDKIVSLTLTAEEIINTHRKEFTAGATVAAGDLCAMNSSGEMVLADADAVATASTMLAVAEEAVTAASSGWFTLFGEVTGLSGLTQGSVAYMSATAGDFTHTAPSTTGQIVRVVGYALSTTSLWFDPDHTWIEVS